MQGRVIAVCISDRRGIRKTEIAGRIRIIEGYGIEGDAHGGNWHRQISLLSLEKIEEFKQRGGDVVNGDFAENIVVSGVDLRTLPVGSRLRVNDALLELTQIGKECHQHCRIFEQVGDCIMPREGVFARVISGGTIGKGDSIDVIAQPFRAAVITVSDRSFAGERPDESGPIVADMLGKAGYHVLPVEILSDDRQCLAARMKAICDDNEADLIVTTGGTGFSPRDCTPEATMDIAERVVPGIPEAMRAYSLQKTKRAMLSRATAGIRGRTLIINLPGSSRAAKENLECIIEALHHGIEILTSSSVECGETIKERGNAL